MTREKALKARGIAAQHRHLAKRQATAQPTSGGVSVPVAGAPAAGSGTPETTPDAPTSAIESAAPEEPVEETTSVAVEREFSSKRT